ncbi:MAG TPA: hypothetical protein VMB02_04605 [Candidatus Aquilonibacter sp.]|nr:hypothetical protein [Candidatus Aquilonibacter sp.]
MRMRNHIGRFVPAAIAVAGLLWMAACGGGNSAPVQPTPTPTAAGPVAIFPGTVSVPAGSQAQFSAFLASAPSATFTWAVSSGGGSIDSSTGLYTAPDSVPASPTVTITATGSNAKGTAIVTIVAAPVGGLALNRAVVVVPAGSPFTFSATANGNPIMPTWQVAGITGGDVIHGLIDANGNFTAPLTPPPGGSTTVTALSGGNSVTATVAVVFSNASLNGQYAFSYAGQDSKGPLMVAGSFTANSSVGTISGIEDYNSTSAAPAQASPVSGTFSVNPDGTATATLADAAAGGSEAWGLTLVSSTQGQAAPRALLARFDKTATGSGEADIQNTTQFVLGSFNGNYSFTLSGRDGKGNPLQMAGLLQAVGNNGTIPVNFAKQDINDAGTNTEASPDTTLHGLFATSANMAANGRGTLQLINANTTVTAAVGTFTFAYYIVDSTHLKVVETDANTTAQLSGDFFSAPNTDGSFSNSILKGNYGFTLTGSNATGSRSYATGGVMVTSGNGTISSGELDGSLGTDLSLTSSSYAVDTSLGRILFTFSLSSKTRYLAGYPTTSGIVEMIELDNDFQGAGTAYQQTSLQAPAGNSAFNLTSNGGTAGFNEEDAIGQLSLPADALIPQGNLNINAKGTLTTGTAIENTSTIVAPDASGRGTSVLVTQPASYSLAYYTVSNAMLLAVETDGTRATTALALKQF